MIELYVLTRNRCKCKLCGDIIESTSRHSLVRCKCKSIFTDGGIDYVRRGASDLNIIEDMSEYRDKTLEELESDLEEIKQFREKYSISYGDELSIYEDAIAKLKESK